MAIEPLRNFEMERRFDGDDCDDAKKMSKKSLNESKKLWGIAAPVIITAVSQFSIGIVTIAFVGHLGSLELAAVSVVQNVLQGFVYGIMLGMGSALETLCGQAVGAGQLDMLGVTLQRSCVITLVTALFLTPFYIFTSPILKLLRQDKHISEVAGKYAVWVIPQLYAYAWNFPVQKFLQAQSKIWVMTVINIVVLVFHILLNWVLVTKLGHGLLGAAMAGNVSWWLVVLAQIFYVISGSFPEAWTGFTMLAFKSLWGFVKLSLASAVMLCLELWYFTLVILMVGWLKSPEIAVDAISTSLALQLWVLMITLGFNAAVSVRVSNELGAGRPKAAKFSILIALITSTLVGVVFTVAVIATKNYYPRLFSDKLEVIHETSNLAYFLAATIFLMSIQPVLHGVAVGAGWQYSVAIINTVCYYIVGLPLGACLGYIAKIGVKGIWTGMLAGTLVQTIVLTFKMWKANWRKEAIHAEERVRTYGDQPSQDEIEHTESDIEVLQEHQKMEAKPMKLWKKVWMAEFKKWMAEFKKWMAEFKKVCHIAGPTIVTSVSVFSLECITAAFAGQLGNVELAAVSEVQNVLLGFVTGIMLGLGSALETLCGQAVGAGKFNMLGVYLQRSWIISIVAGLLLTPIYVFASQILKLLHQDPKISDLSGKYAIWIIPEIFASALNYPTEKFLQAQSKVWFMAFTSLLTLANHVLLNWILVTKLRMGLVGAAIAGNISFWILVVAKIIYITCGWFPEAWTGFSYLAFKSLTNFLKLSVSSAVMLCLEVWYYTAVILVVGGLKDAAIAVDSISICMNLQIWALMFTLGFTVSASVRVSNELGAGNPKGAKFTIGVNVFITTIVGAVFSVIILATKTEFPRMFSNEPKVIRETSKLGYVLALTIFITSIQTVLQGVAIGAGWQSVLAFVNLGCYYGLGLPLGAVLGYKFNLGVQGVWYSMVGGSLLQAIIIIVIIGRTNWHKEAVQAEMRVKTWGGSTDNQQDSS